MHGRAAAAALIPTCQYQWYSQPRNNRGKTGTKTVQALFSKLDWLLSCLSVCPSAIYGYWFVGTSTLAALPELHAGWLFSFLGLLKR